MSNSIIMTTDMTRAEPAKVCRDTGVLCNRIIKQHNVAVIEPYTFGMDDDQWNFLKEFMPLEYNLAIVFSLSKDLSKYTDRFWLDSSKVHAYHTLMYIEFNNFIIEACLNRAAIAISMLETASLTFGTPKLSLMGLNKMRTFAMQSIDNHEVIGQAVSIIKNRGPAIVNEQLFYLIFQKQYHSETLILKKKRKGFKAINRIDEIKFMKEQGLWTKYR